MISPFDMEMIANIGVYPSIIKEKIRVRSHAGAWERVKPSQGSGARSFASLRMTMERTTLLWLVHLRPGVAQRNRPVEHQCAFAGVIVDAEVGKPFELEPVPRICTGERTLQFASGERLERIRIDPALPVLPAGVFHRKQPVVEPDFRIDRVWSRNPVDGAFDLLLAVRRTA